MSSAAEAAQVGGDEDLPRGCVALLCRQQIDVLSHAALRARATGAFVACCSDSAALDAIAAGFDGQRVRLCMNGDQVECAADSGEAAAAPSQAQPKQLPAAEVVKTPALDSDRCDAPPSTHRKALKFPEVPGPRDGAHCMPRSADAQGLERCCMPQPVHSRRGCIIAEAGQAANCPHGRSKQLDSVLVLGALRCSGPCPGRPGQFPGFPLPSLMSDCALQARISGIPLTVHTV